MGSENFASDTGSHLEKLPLDPNAIFAAEKMIGPPPPADTAHVDTGPEFYYPLTKEVPLTYDPQVDENAKKVRITIIAQPPR